MQACSQNLFDQRTVRVGRRADIDDVQLIACQQFAELRGVSGYAKLLGSRFSLGSIQIADCLDFKVIRDFCVRLQMAFANTQTHNGNAQFPCHFKPPKRTAMASAFNASSVARKQCC